MKKYQFEVCANSVESCLAAQAGGADRVELCAGIPEGGTTPSYGEISTARDMLTTTRLHVIIRPRGGDFLYSPIEVRTMLKDIEMARQLGADGVVFGCLTANGEIDLPVMQELMKASQGYQRLFTVLLIYAVILKRLWSRLSNWGVTVSLLPVSKLLPNSESPC